MQPAGIPPAGQVWFGAGYDPDTLAVCGRTTTVRTNAAFVVVAHFAQAHSTIDLTLTIFKNGLYQSRHSGSELGSGIGDLYEFATDGIDSEGVWKYAFTNPGGDLLASGRMTVSATAPGANAAGLDQPICVMAGTPSP